MERFVIKGGAELKECIMISITIVAGIIVLLSVFWWIERRSDRAFERMLAAAAQMQANQEADQEKSKK